MLKGTVSKGISRAVGPMLPLMLLAITSVTSAQIPHEVPVEVIPYSCTGINQVGGVAAGLALGQPAMSMLAVDHQFAGTKETFVDDPYTGTSYMGSFKAKYETTIGGVLHVILYPDAMVTGSLILTGPNGVGFKKSFLSKDDLANCTPKLLGYLVGILAHEALHAHCAPHGIPPAGLSDDEKAAYNLCNELNYALHAAEAVCGMIAMIAAQGCQPPILDGGTPPMPILGLDDSEDVAEFCTALQSRYDTMQKGANTPAGASAAFDCACSMPPWSPGPMYSTCPSFPQPKSGDCTSVATAYPNDEVIPDCESDCGSCN